ncbi:unnamed protein product [Brachionus calyciflorus]|uniref:Uncharacterized protein n=1 Tax=Brachionus calyciflorus TaxID=104777 RepID=A0A813QNM5_9BILA|nr:unnamed protein product [Brachionus calyciflorus]
MCIVFLTENVTKQVKESYEFLNYLISTREQLSPAAEQSIYLSTMGELKTNLCQIESECDQDDRTIFKKSTIKEASPFTAHFINIKQEAINYSKIKNGDINHIRNDSYIDFLEKNFLPYAFVWSGFVFRNLNISRLTNGTIEKFFATRKNLVKSSVQPGVYINLTSDVALGQALRFTNKLLNQDESDQPQALQLNYNQYEEAKENSETKAPKQIDSSIIENSETKLTLVKLDVMDPNFFETVNQSNDYQFSDINIQNVKINQMSLKRLLENDRLCDSILEAFFRTVGNDKKTYV